MPLFKDPERTEPATPKRRGEARRKGQVAKSKEVSSTIVLAVAIFFLYFFSRHMLEVLSQIMIEDFKNLSYQNVNLNNVRTFAILLIYKVSLILLPFMLSVTIAGLLAEYLQVGTLFTLDPLKPNLGRLNPINGIKRLFSLSSLFELVKSIAKIGIVGYFIYLFSAQEIKKATSTALLNTSQILLYMGKASFKIMVKIIFVLGILAVLDYLYQRWEYEESLKMTKQEVKEEFRQLEGDPNVKSRIRSLQFEMARRRMMAEVPKAEVVITNPTHIAVALAYKLDKDLAPYVVAKGAGVIAEKIKEVARDHSIPIVENKELARYLFLKVEIGEYIPKEVYRAVAKILAYIYNLKGEKVGS